MNHDATSPVTSVPVTSVPVVIVGAGPVGLSLALGLARHGVRSLLLERDATTSEQSKAPVIHVRTREVLRLWNVEERLLAAGQLVRRVTVHAGTPGRKPLYAIDFTDLEPEAAEPGLLVLEQGDTERLLLNAVRETGVCDTHFATEAIGLRQDPGGVQLTVRHAGKEETVTAGFVVGCDGASSFVREALGLPFDGLTYSLRPMLADVRVNDARDELPWPRVWNAARHLSFTARLPTGLWRIVMIARDEPAYEAVATEEVRACVEQLLGPGPAEIVWSSRFRIHKRSSPRFRVGRVLLAGDAAHVHSPAGGFGMNGGIQDAHNLAWKLAAALSGGDTDRLLDSYDAERRAVIVESVSRVTDLLTRGFIDAPAGVRRALFYFLRQAVRSSRIRRKVLRRTAMLDLDYPSSPLLDGGDRAAGKRLPNLLLRTPQRAEVRLYDLLPTGPLLLHVAQDREQSMDLPWESLRIGSGGYRDPSGRLRKLLGGKDGWILVRPDAHIAWARHDSDGIDGAVRRALGML